MRVIQATYEEVNFPYLKEITHSIGQPMIDDYTLNNFFQNVYLIRYIIIFNDSI